MFYDNYDLWWDNEPTNEELEAIEAEANGLASVHTEFEEA